ncbi:hypothetical protein, partial [Magnetospirillum moscoviense]|uniref:hypothetical protein n=1 Tax=Magnetospirillum moscoviense TaxID=1437059 RepID=UPI001C12A8C2
AAVIFSDILSLPNMVPPVSGGTPVIHGCRWLASPAESDRAFAGIMRMRVDGRVKPGHADEGCGWCRENLTGQP